MGKLIVLAPTVIGTVTASRGADVENLLTVDPREVWADDATGSAASLRIDLGAVHSIDTVFLGHAYPLHPAASWTIRGGAGGYTQTVIAAADTMRVVDSATSAPARSHALWHGTPADVRYLQIDVVQPAGAAPISIGTLMIGKAFVAQFNKEWNSGRRVLDTGRASRLPSGGFGVAPGVRLGSYSWTFGDLSIEETDALYDIQLQVGETSPILVVEDPDRTAGQLHRIHYSKFTGLKPYKRRNRAQTRWEFEVEQWG